MTYPLTDKWLKLKSNCDLDLSPVTFKIGFKALHEKNVSIKFGQNPLKEVG
jgi:hypothetical protein